MSVTFHSAVTDGVFDLYGDELVFYPATDLTDADIATVQSQLRTRILRHFEKNALLDADAVEDMLAWEHDAGFSLDGSVTLDDWNRDGLERLLRYCARPSFSLILFDTDHPDVMYQAFRDLDSSDYTALDLDTPRPGYGWYSLEADEATFYDRPIAVLQGPHAASAGDIFPWLMTLHPRTRRFGLPTHGSFGGLVCWRCTEPDPHLSDLYIALTNHTDLDASLAPLQGSDQIPEQTVVLDRDDVAAGTDTVVRAALDWISE